MTDNIPPTTAPAAGPSSKVREIFKSASEENRNLIRDILKEERDVQHMTRRNEIHSKIYDHVRRLIKWYSNA